MIQKNLHQRGAVKIRQFGDLPDYSHMPEFFNGFAVLAVLIADQHHAVHRLFRRVQSRQC